VDDLDPAPFTDAKIAWFETTTTTTPYIDTDPLTEKIYYAAEYKITSVGDYCVNPNRVPVNVSLYSNKIYPIVKESVCSKQNGSIEFINPPAGVTFEWYEQADPTTLDFTGAKYNKPLEKQSFKIKIKDVSGCEEEVSVALPECTDSPIPQILSPNNDEFNNKWVINYSGKYKNVQVRIFNRWGNEVYTSSIPYKDDWDGKRNNEYLPSGTYYYVIDKGNGEPIESGYIELIK
jgi:gliding motility-associated-like protein